MLSKEYHVVRGPEGYLPPAAASMGVVLPIMYNKFRKIEFEPK